LPVAYAAKLQILPAAESPMSEHILVFERQNLKRQFARDKLIVDKLLPERQNTHPATLRQVKLKFVGHAIAKVYGARQNIYEIARAEIGFRNHSAFRRHLFLPLFSRL
jgi:hypothetical protein